MKQCRIELRQNGRVVHSEWVEASKPVRWFITIQQFLNKIGCTFNIVEYK